MIKLQIIIFLAVFAALSAADQKTVRNRRGSSRNPTPITLSVVGICYKSSLTQELFTHTPNSVCSTKTQSSNVPYVVIKAKDKRPNGNQLTTDRIITELNAHMDYLYLQAYAHRYSQSSAYCIPRSIAAARVERRRRGFEEEWLSAFPLARFVDLAFRYYSYATDPANLEYQLHANPPSTPFTTIVTRGPNNLPVYMRATIRRQHIPPPRQRGSIPNHVRKHLSDNFGLLEGDEAALLLAYSLGGGIGNLFNYAPQTSILNRNVGQSYSLWPAIETSIKKYLETNPTGHVDWQLLVIYDLDGVIKRPIGFCLQHENFDYQGRSVIGLQDWCFSNDPNDECVFARNPFNT